MRLLLTKIQNIFSCSYAMHCEIIEVINTTALCSLDLHLLNAIFTVHYKQMICKLTHSST